MKQENISSATRCWDLIQRAKKVTLLTHEKPDGDGISACAAMENFLLEVDPNKAIETVFPTKVELPLQRMPKSLSINTHKNEPDLIVAFDTANIKRLYFPTSFHSKTLINIDHHISNNIPGQFNIIEIETSSSCEMLFYLMQIWSNENITKYVAECLLVGILSDSQVFHTQSTYPSTLLAGAALMEKGANLFELKTELLSNKNPQIIAFWGELMSKVKISNNKKAAWIVVKQSDLKKHELTLSSLIGFNNFISQIAGVDITALFYETDEGGSKVSLRSKRIDVNKIASQFGGGGHKKAAGILLKQPIDEVEKLITTLF